MAIRFNRLGDPYGAFSNFAPYPIVINRQIWPTSEHYFQAQKFFGTPYEAAIRQAASPKLAAQLGRSRSEPIRPDWEAVKEQVMLEALRAKFTQHVPLRELLLETGEATLIEHRQADAYWGDGGDGHGLNRLGILLMQVRAELRGG